MLKISPTLLFVLGVTFLFGQEVIRFTTKQGLPSNHVYDIAQDTAGFMWFATNRGVVKFDGSNFKTFTVKDGLPNNDTWRIEADFQGRIWYFSKSNYQGYIQNDSIYKFIVPDSMPITPKYLFKSKEQLQIMGYPYRYRLGVLDDAFIQLNKENHDKFTDYVRKMNRENKRKYSHWFSEGHSKMEQYIKITEGKIECLDANFNILFQNNHVDLSVETYIDYGGLPNQIFYIITSEGILFIDHQKKLSKYIVFENLIRGLDLTGIERIFCKGLLNEIQISISGYLIRVNYNFELIEVISIPKEIPNLVNYKDRDGNIWAVKKGKGITFLPNSQLQSHYYLKEKNIHKLGQVDQSLFAGIQNEGFYEYNVDNNNFIKRIEQDPNIVYQIRNDSLRQVGYLIGGLYSLEYKNKTFNKIGITIKTHPKVYSFFKDLVNFRNCVYALTSNNLHKKDLKTKEDIHILDKQGMLIADVYDDTLFVGANDGLFKFSDDNLTRPNIEKEIINTSILSFLPTKDYLIVGTDGRGIYFYDKGEIIHLQDTDDLSVQRIIKQDNHLWIATQKGVFKITLNTTNLKNSSITDAFYEIDGLLENNTNDIYLEENWLYVASDMGLAKVDLHNPLYRKKPKIYFKTSSDTLKLKGGSSTIDIDFAILDYVNQEHYAYSYRLLPMRENWSNTKSTTINFSNLSPNLYTLEVKVQDHHGNQSIAKQYLEVSPAWWQTVWAKMGGTLFLSLLFWGVLKFFQIRIQRKAEREKHIAGLELQALRSQMNPHFVHNSLNAIQYYIQRSEIDLSEEYLEKFSKLIRLFFEYSRKQHISLFKEVQLLNNYLEMEKLRFEEKLRYSIQLDEAIDQFEQLIPSMILQPIVENAVNHGLFHKEGVGTIDISFHYLSEVAFEVLIKDDGIGINKAKEIFETSSKNYQSRSSEVLHERLTLLKQSNIWNINYQIEDLSDGKNASGTLVTLTFNQLNN